MADEKPLTAKDVKRSRAEAEQIAKADAELQEADAARMRARVEPHAKMSEVAPRTDEGR